MQASQPALEKLLSVMEKLRDPEGGCPWDLQQDFKSLVPSTLEEAYELAFAIEEGNIEHISEELGDVLFQVIFYSQLGSEQGEFEFVDIAEKLTEKLVRRHPHVFPPEGGLSESTGGQRSDQIKASWEAIKKQERSEREQTGVLADIPSSFPALTRAQKLQKRAAGVGFDWESAQGVLDKLWEELAELEHAMAEADTSGSAEELGDLLFCCVNMARHMDLDAESVLRRANLKFERRFSAVETLLEEEGIGIEQASIEQMDSAWEKVKKTQ